MAAYNDLKDKYVTSLAVYGSNLIAATADSGLFRSTDNGLSWIKTSLANGVSALTFYGTNLIAGTEHGTYLSTDSGKSWTSAISFMSPNVYCVYAFAILDTTIIAGTPDGVFCSSDGGINWIPLKTYLANTNVQAFAISNSNVFAGTSGDGVFLSTNNGISWSRIDDGLTSPYVYALKISGTNLFSGTLNSGFFRSIDYGKHWLKYDIDSSSSTVVAFAVSGTNLFAATSGGVFRSTNNGINWHAAGSGLPSSNSCGFNTFAVSDSNLFVGTSGGVFLTTDDGISWTATGLMHGDVSALAIAGTNLIAGTLFDGIFLSTDFGSHWHPINIGLTNSYILSLAVYGSYLYAGTFGGGVVLSTDGGKTWQSINSGLPAHSNVSALAVCDSILIAGTNSNGVWKRPLSEISTSVEVHLKDLPMHFSLYQNYPNPFNPSTTISFILPLKSLVFLKVFDILGREVATLANEEMLAGNHSFNWNAANLASGIYFYRLQAGSFTETKKLILLR